SGYSPNQYPTEDEWQARRIIEKSTAIKCPWIGAQLAGSKKIQQVLTNYRELIKFQSDRTCHNMMDTFAKIYSLDSDNVDRESLLKKVRKNPHSYVLKEIPKVRACWRQASLVPTWNVSKAEK
uniref:Glutathione synthetase n=1 Tax=Romanomermis culicivorax TaxID=13658 RepID=A0A915JC56_ROMCU